MSHVQKYKYANYTKYILSIFFAQYYFFYKDIFEKIYISFSFYIIAIK